jgi:hypothetical protein
MSFPILTEYETHFPQNAALLRSLPHLYSKRYPLLHAVSGTN